MRSCPMYSASDRGRSPASYWASSTAGTPVIMRSDIAVLAAFLPASHQLAQRGLECNLEGGFAARAERGIDGLLGQGPMISEVQQRREQVVAQPIARRHRRGRFLRLDAQLRHAIFQLEH